MDLKTKNDLKPMLVISVMEPQLPKAEGNSIAVARAKIGVEKTRKNQKNT